MNVRDAFFTQVYNDTVLGKDFSIVSSDLGAPSLDEFRVRFPQRFVNVGIAEQNSLAVAAGLCYSGKSAITYGLNPFPVTRAFDHIRNLMASLRIPITVAALKVGICTAEAGFSHMPIENVSLLRTLKNIKIINPSDETISRKLVKEIERVPFPRYVQFDPQISGILYDENEIDFDKGFAVLGEESDVAVVTYGFWVREILKENLKVKLIDCFSLPVNEELFVNEIMKHKKVITIEDAVATGGIGSMVLEICNDHDVSVPIKRMALRFNNGYPHVYSNRKMILEDEAVTVDKLRELL